MTTARRLTIALGAIGALVLGAAPPAQAAITLSIISSAGAPFFIPVSNPSNAADVTLVATAGGPITVGTFTIRNLSLSHFFNPFSGPPYVEGVASQTQIGLTRGATGAASETLTITATYTIDAGQTFLPGSPISAFGTLSSDRMEGTPGWTVRHTGTVEGLSYTPAPLTLTGPIPPAQMSQVSPTVTVPRSGAIDIVQVITVTMGLNNNGDYLASTVVTNVPEPSNLISLAALGAPFLGVLVARRRRRP